MACLVDIRVNTKAQDTAAQEADLKKWVKANAGDVDVVWYRDKFTGKVMDRPSWSALDKAMRAGNVSSP